MKNELKKLSKGIVALFLINIVLFSSISIFQSCTMQNSDETFNTNDAKSNLLSSVQSFYKTLKSIPVIKKTKNTFNKSKSVLENMFLTESYVSQYSNNPIENLVINNYEDIIVIANEFDLILTDNQHYAIENNLDVLGYYQIDVNPFIEATEPTIFQAEHYLISLGFDSSDIEEVLEGVDESIIIPMTLELSAGLDKNYPEITYIKPNFSFLFMQSANAQQVNWTLLARCAKRAFGLDDLRDFANWKTMGKKAQKKLLKKVAGKMAARYASAWIGVAIIIGEFALCMY